MGLTDVIEQNQRALLALSDPELTRLLPVLKQLRDETAEAIAKNLALEKSRGISYAQHRQHAMLAQIDEAIAAARKKIPFAVQTDLRSGSHKNGIRALANLQRMISAGEKKFTGAVSGLRLDVASIMSSADDALMHRHRTSAIRYAGRVGERVRRDMLIGVIKGDSTSTIAKRLLRGKYEEDPEIAGKRVAQSRFFKNQSDAECLVITEMNNAYNVIQLHGLEEANEDDPGWGKMWDATLDMRTCPVCWEMHGEIRPTHALFSCGVPHPPLHPRDRCGIVPWRMNWPRGKFATHYDQPDPEIPGLRRAARKVEIIQPKMIQVPDASRRGRNVRKLAASIQRRDKTER